MFLWFWIISMMALSIFLCICLYIQCVPVESIWDPRVPKKYCILDLTTVATIMCGKPVAIRPRMRPRSMR